MVEYKVLKEEDIELVDRKSLEALEQIGVRIDSEKTLKMLEEKGCAVDFENQVVCFPRAIVCKALEDAPSSFTLGGFDQAHDMEMGAGNTYVACDGQGCFTHDLTTGQRRTSTMQDLVDAAKVVDEMDYLMCAWPTVTANDVPDEMRTIREMVEMWRVSSKHIQTDCYNEAQAKCYLEVLDAIFGRERILDKPPLSVCCCPVSPLQFEGPMLEGTIALGEANVPAIIMDAPIMGMTSPMSLFSEVIQNNIEVLAGITILELAHPGRKVFYSFSCDAMDMKSNACLEGSVEGMLVDIACVQMAKHYHVPSLGAMATDGHVPGMQTGVERALKAQAYFAIGVDLMSGTGLTSSSMCLRFDELVFDEDIIRIARRMAEGIRGGEDNALTDDLFDVGIGGNFLMVESTLEYLRNGEHYQPRHYRRESYESWKAEGFPDPMEEAAGKAREIIAHHDKNNYSPELSAKLEEIISKAEQAAKE